MSANRVRRRAPPSRRHRPLSGATASGSACCAPGPKIVATHAAAAAARTRPTRRRSPPSPHRMSSRLHSRLPIPRRGKSSSTSPNSSAIRLGGGGSGLPRPLTARSTDGIVDWRSPLGFEICTLTISPSSVMLKRTTASAAVRTGPGPARLMRLDPAFLRRRAGTRRPGRYRRRPRQARHLTRSAPPGLAAAAEHAAARDHRRRDCARPARAAPLPTAAALDSRKRLRLALRRGRRPARPAWRPAWPPAGGGGVGCAAARRLHRRRLRDRLRGLRRRLRRLHLLRLDLRWRFGLLGLRSASLRLWPRAWVRPRPLWAPPASALTGALRRAAASLPLRLR